MVSIANPLTCLPLLNKTGSLWNCPVSWRIRETIDFIKAKPNFGLLLCFRLNKIFNVWALYPHKNCGAYFSYDPKRLSYSSNHAYIKDIWAWELGEAFFLLNNPRSIWKLMGFLWRVHLSKNHQFCSSGILEAMSHLQIASMVFFEGSAILSACGIDLTECAVFASVYFHIDSPLLAFSRSFYATLSELVGMHEKGIQMRGPRVITWKALGLHLLITSSFNSSPQYVTSSKASYATSSHCPHTGATR